jgi:hypothetical protein
MIPAAKVVQHYGEADLRDRLRAALTAAGLDNKQLLPADLAPLDQFHARGMAATVDLSPSIVEAASYLAALSEGCVGIAQAMLERP